MTFPVCNVPCTHSVLQLQIIFFLAGYCFLFQFLFVLGRDQGRGLDMRRQRQKELKQNSVSQRESSWRGGIVSNQREWPGSHRRKLWPVSHPRWVPSLLWKHRHKCLAKRENWPSTICLLTPWGNGNYRLKETCPVCLKNQKEANSSEYSLRIRCYFTCFLSYLILNIPDK